MRPRPCGGATRGSSTRIRRPLGRRAGGRSPCATSSWPAAAPPSLRSCGWPASLTWKTMRRLLELFSGTGSMGRAFAELGWEVTSLDVDPKADPTICADICSWGAASQVRPRLLRHDLGFACLHRIQQGLDSQAQAPRGGRRTLQIIQKLQPRFWALENPATGLLKLRPFMAGLPWQDVSYCTYGYPYRKLTRIWSNLDWVPERPVCGLRGYGVATLRLRRGAPSAARAKSCRTATPRVSCTASRQPCAGR